MLSNSFDGAFFGGFFTGLKNRLDYSTGLGEYQEFLHLVSSDWGMSIIGPDTELSLWALCRAMFLKYPKDEQLFRETFDGAFAAEKNRLTLRLHHLQRSMEAPATPQETAQAAQEDRKKQASTAREEEEESDNPAGREDAGKEDSQTPAAAELQPSHKYLNLSFKSTAKKQPTQPGAKTSAEGQGQASKGFDFKNSWLPMPRRDMIQSWRLIRNLERRGLTTDLDIEATAHNLSKEGGLFIEPAFLPKKFQRQDTLIIFSDRKGSMVPFHELSDTLIQAAVTDAGHRAASVLYFQNDPASIVFRRPGLSEGLTLRQALRKANPQKTVALVISDAGAARGNTRKARIEETWDFLDTLKSKVARVAWLNPMPMYRWKNTSAQYIATEVSMHPVFDAERSGFAQALRVLAGKDVPKNMTL